MNDVFRMGIVGAIAVLTSVAVSLALVSKPAAAASCTATDYQYVDLFAGYFPVPGNYVLSLSTLESNSESEGSRSYVTYSLPQRKHSKLFSGKDACDWSSIEIGLSADIDAAAPPSEILEKVNEIKVNEISIHRYGVAQEESGLPNLYVRCFERMFIGGFYIYVMSTECGLSEILAEQVIHRKDTEPVTIH